MLCKRLKLLSRVAWRHDASLVGLVDGSRESGCCGGVHNVDSSRNNGGNGGQNHNLSVSVG